jgi:hypothetical protein
MTDEQQTLSYDDAKAAYDAARDAHEIAQIEHDNAKIRYLNRHAEYLKARGIADVACDAYRDADYKTCETRHALGVARDTLELTTVALNNANPRGA